MRFLPAVAALCAVVACSPEIPDSGAGVGFGDYGAFMRERERERARQAARPASIVPPAQVVSLPPQQTPSQSAQQGGAAAVPASPIRTAAVQAAPIQQAPLSALAPAPVTAPVPPPVTAQAQPPATGASAPITTQDFPTLAAAQGGTVSYPAPAQGTVQMVAPTAVPARPSDIPNIVEYALNTRNSVGQQVWRRSVLTMQNTDRNCRSFVNSDLAQEEFLRRGGPQRDPQNLDPDGDGFACWWDPAPFRAAAMRAAN